MRKILFSLVLILGAGSALATGASGAFFSDTESSTGNTFAAGAIDLKIDNDSWYNGNHCVNIGTSAPDWRWQGNASYPASGSPCDTSWAEDDLSNGHLFFNFHDLKPDDESEDTISMHVQNDAWACLKVSLTSNDDVSSVSPELNAGDVKEDAQNIWDGELAQNIQMVWWADDGDNVLEADEVILTGDHTVSGGVQSLYNLAATSPFRVALADSNGNAWGGENPLPANETVYIAKAWCFGTLTIDPVGADLGINPGVASGTHCDGTSLNNITQTDSATVDVEFETQQSRNNPNFVCPQNQSRTATLTLVKTVNNGEMGGAAAAVWTLSANGPTPISGHTGEGSITNAEVLAGAYTLSENNAVPGYTASTYSCVINGGAPVLGNNINLVGDDVAVCTITNTIQACGPQQLYATSVIQSSQGVRKNGTPVLVARTNPASALGAPQSTGAFYDNPPPADSNFFSLGFKNNGATPGGSIVVSFPGYIVDGPGNDLKVWEVTGGTNYPDEHIKIEVSQDGSNWFTAANDLTRDAVADLATSGLSWAKFVRLTDISPIAPFEATADGYDLDAFSALHCSAPLVLVDANN